MAEVWATKTGQWSDTTVWNTGSLPTSIDDVFANTFTVTISNINPQVLSIRNTPRTGGTTGGTFSITNGVSLTANVLCNGVAVCLSFSQAAPNTCTIVGTISATTGNINTVQNVGTGTMYIYGNILGATTQGTTLGNTAGGTIFVYGNITGGGGGTGNNCIGAANTSNGIINVIGNITGGITAGSSNLGINNSSTGTINVTGNVIGGVGNSAHGINNAANGTVTIYGNVLGGNGNTVYGISNGSSGNVTIYGNLSGGNAGTCIGVLNSSTGNVYVYGNCFGGTSTNCEGVRNQGAGGAYVYGTVRPGIGSAAVGLLNNSNTGTLYATKVIGNEFGLGSVGINSNVAIANSQNGRAYVEQVEFGSRGATPISGPVYILPSNQNTLTGVLTALGNTVTFYNSLSVDGLIPPASSVRLGEVYNVGNSVGTMAVPAPEQVEFGVPVDNTVGTAALTPQTIWGYSRLSATDVGSMGDRLRNAATAQSVGSQIASFNL